MQIGVILPIAEDAGVTPGWPVVRSFAVAAEDRGLDSVWIFDHFFYQRPDGPVQGMHEAWSMVSAVAAITSRVQIGTLVLCSPFRNPGLVAKMAAAADEISGGRLILGVGAGWHDPEFAAFGYPFDHLVDRFAETLPILTGLLDGGRVTAVGSHHQVRDARLLPPPARRIPVLVAAKGPRMLRLTARHADAWNTAWYGWPDDRLHAQLDALATALDAEGRDPAAITRTVGVEIHDPERAPAPEPGDPGISGSVSDVAAALDAYAALGIDHLTVQLMPHDEVSLDRLAAACALRG